MPKFQFRILTGENEAACKAKYDRLAVETSTGSGIFTHDPYTFYLFDQGGIGYLGDTPLFGGDASKFNMISSNKAYADLKPNAFYFCTANCTVTDDEDPHVATHTLTQGSIWITNGSSVPNEISWTNFTTYMARYITGYAIQSDGTNLPSDDTWDETFEGNDTTLLTSAATRTLINNIVNAQAILSISFFKAVELHTITAAEITAGEVTVFTDHTASITNAEHEGDIGLAFMCQTGSEYDETENDGDICVFVNLHSLINLYTGSTSDTAEVVVAQDLTGDPSGHTQKITVNVNKSEEIFHANGTADNFETKIMAAIDQVINYRDDGENNQDYVPTTAVASGGHGFSSNKFISESQLADILAHVLSHFAQVQYDSIVVSGGSMEEDEGGDL